MRTGRKAGGNEGGTSGGREGMAVMLKEGRSGGNFLGWRKRGKKEEEEEKQSDFKGGRKSRNK